MADKIVIMVPREELAAAFGKSPRLIRAFENLTREVTVVLPGETTIVLQIAQEARSNSEGLGLGALGPRNPVPPSTRPGAGLTSVADAAGQVLDVDPGFAAQAARAFGQRPSVPPPERPINDGDLVMSMRTFLPRPAIPEPQRAASDAQDILAARIFNRR